MKPNPRRKCNKSTLFWRQVLFSARIYKTQIFRKRKWHQCILLSLSMYMATKQISPRLPKKLLASSICKVMCNSISGTAEMQAERGGQLKWGKGDGKILRNEWPIRLCPERMGRIIFQVASGCSLWVVYE